MVAAVVRRGDRVLIARRHHGADRGGLWEFPGGKVEAGEAEPDALAREIREELGCAIHVGRLMLRHRHRYPDLEVELAFYACALAEAEDPRALGAAELCWAPAGSLASYQFCEADVAILGDIARAPAGTGDR